MKVCVTGATGLVGRSLVEALSRRGVELVGVTRQVEGARAARPDVTWVACDLLDADGAGAALAQACAGAGAVVHLAGAMPPEPEACLAINRGGAERVVAAARAAGVGRLVLISSTAVYGDAPPRADESTPLAGADGYAASKRAAEDAVFGGEDGGGPRPAVVRPCMITGPGDGNLAGGLAALVGADQIPLPAKGATLHDLVAADDVADLVARLVLDHPRATGIWNAASGSPLSLAELITLAADTLGRTPRLQGMSLDQAAAALASAAEAGQPPPFPPQLVGLAAHERTYDIARARALGWRPRPARQALTEALTALPA